MIGDLILDGNCTIADFRCFLVGEAMKSVNLPIFHQSGYGIANVVKDFLIPFHAGASWK